MAEQFHNNDSNAARNFLLKTGQPHELDSISPLLADAGVVPHKLHALHKDEPVAPLQKDLELPKDQRTKDEFAVRHSFMGGQTTTCDHRPQSTWITGKPVADDCDIPLSSIYPKVKDSVTQAIVRQPDGTTNWGAAFKYCDQSSKKCVYITNDHVAQDADQVGLVAQDGKTLKYGRVLSRDAEHDMVTVEVPAGDTRPSVEIGPPPKVDDPVFTVGHPYGIPGDVISAGYVLDTNTTITDRNSFQQYSGLIQSDILATPGNSGGPEFNKKGQVIGIKSNAGMYGTSDSIPIKTATDMVK